MHPVSRRVRSHRPIKTFAGVLSALLLGIAALAGSASASANGPAMQGRQDQAVTVMTRNLYLGADLFPVIGALAQNPAGVPAAASQTWAAVQATKPGERMTALAKEIARNRPAVVGLQEVTRWTTYSTYPAADAGTVRYDFLQLLLRELAKRGAPYREVAGATAENFGSPPIPLAPGSGAAAVSMGDRDVILARAGVKTSNAHTGQYSNIISFPLAGGSVLPVKRGWGSVDVRAANAKFRFVNSHLEAFGVPGMNAEGLRYQQVGELLSAQQAIAQQDGVLPTVYVGDYNSVAPSAAAYSRLVSSVGSDAWLETRPGEPGFTCCFDAAVSDPTATLDQRIDLVVHDSRIDALGAWIVGDKLGDRTGSGLWPSDHAGVVARLRILR